MSAFNQSGQTVGHQVNAGVSGPRMPADSWELLEHLLLLIQDQAVPSAVPDANRRSLLLVRQNARAAWKLVHAARQAGEGL